MKKISIIIFIVSFSFITYSQNSVKLGWKEKYFLDNKETNLALNDSIVANYSIYDKDTIHQVPLSKYIEAENYKLFIGWAIYDSPKSIYNYYLTNKEYSIIEKDTVFEKKFKYFKILASFNNSFILKYIFVTRKSKFTIVLTYCSDNKEILSNIYKDETFILNKLHKK